MTFNFSDKNAVITGAASGIGRATTEKFVDLGAKVYAIDLDVDGLDELVNGRPTMEKIVADVIIFYCTLNILKIDCIQRNRELTVTRRGVNLALKKVACKKIACFSVRRQGRREPIGWGQG